MKSTLLITKLLFGVLAIAIASSFVSSDKTSYNTSSTGFYGTAWAVTDQNPSALTYFDLSENTLNILSEGSILGMSKIDIEAIAIHRNGTFYLANNVGNSTDLYSISADEVDHDESTPVNAVLIGNTGITNQNNELASLTFIDGVLYAIGKKDKKLYSISIIDASLTLLATLNTGTFRTDGLTQGTDGTVYLSKTLNSNSEIWKFETFPSADIVKVATLSGTGKVEGLSAHPNGLIYASDDEHWYTFNPSTLVTEILNNHNTDVEGIEIYQFENFPPPEPEDCDNDGISDVDDGYDCDVDRTFDIYYPSKDGFTAFCYEDLWPSKGDFDLNDMIIHHNYKFVVNANNEVKDIIIKGKMAARGAGLRNGFGLAIAGLGTSDLESAVLNLGGNNNITPESGHSNNLVFIIVDDVHNYMKGNNGEFNFFNTQEGDKRNFIDFELTITFNNNISDLANLAPFNPFLFRADNRAIEVHIINHEPTELADNQLFNTKEDASIAGGSKYYRTHNNLPWALEIPSSWNHPLEKISIEEAYPKIIDWAESDGLTNTDWYTDYVDGKVWK